MPLIKSKAFAIYSSKHHDIGTVLIHSKSSLCRFLEYIQTELQWLEGNEPLSHWLSLISWHEAVPSQKAESKRYWESAEGPHHLTIMYHPHQHIP